MMIGDNRLDHEKLPKNENLEATTQRKRDSIDSTKFSITPLDPIAHSLSFSVQHPLLDGLPMRDPLDARHSHAPSFLPSTACC